MKDQVDLYIVRENQTPAARRDLLDCMKYGREKISNECIYTHNKAAELVDLFEEVLSRYDIHVPSPEDEDRDEEDMIGLYGSTYSDLLDSVENFIVELLKSAGGQSKIITDTFL